MNIKYSNDFLEYFRNQEKSRMSKRLKTVTRAYGGVLSHKAVRYLHSTRGSVL